MNYNEKFCFVKQMDETDCGAACLAIISKYHGKSISIARIRNLAGTDTQGTSAKGIGVNAVKEAIVAEINI